MEKNFTTATENRQVYSDNANRNGAKREKSWNYFTSVLILAILLVLDLSSWLTRCSENPICLVAIVVIILVLVCALFRLYRFGEIKQQQIKELTPLIPSDLWYALAAPMLAVHHFVDLIYILLFEYSTFDVVFDVVMTVLWGVVVIVKVAKLAIAILNLRTRTHEAEATSDAITTVAVSLTQALELLSPGNEKIQISTARRGDAESGETVLVTTHGDVELTAQYSIIPNNAAE